MTQLQKALDYIENANYADYFELMTKILGKNNVLATLRKEYIAYREVPPTFAEKLIVFARQELNMLSAPSKFLTNFAKPTDFIGRTTELANLHGLLEEGKKSVIVNGLGGIGKTSLARQYAWQYKEHYHHLVWLEQPSSLLSAFTLEQKLTQLVSPEKETAEAYCQKILQHLATTEGKNLLVIDNYEATETDKSIDFLSQFQDADFAHWRVLFTSREKVTGFTPIALDTLPQDEAIKLFVLHSEQKPFDEKVLIQILEEIGYHTFTIELLAKTYSNNIDLENLTVLLEVLQTKDFDNELVQEMVTTQHHKGEASLYKHLLLLFNMEKWTADEQHLLKQFAALPSLPINGKQLLDWLQNNRATYKKALQNLTRKGWLSTTDQENYTLHRLLKMLIQKHLGVKWEDVKVLVGSVKREVTDGKIEANSLAAKPFIAYLESFLESIYFQNDEIEMSYLQHELGCIYHYTAIYKQAVEYYSQASATIKKCKGIENQEYTASLNNLGMIYVNQGKYEEAMILYQEVLKIEQQLLGKKHPAYATILNNLGRLCDNQGKYEEAIVFHQEALQIRKELFGEKHTEYALSLNNLGATYNSLEKYEEAIALYQEALRIQKESVGKKHPNYATPLNNLAWVYSKKGKYEEAIPLYQETLQILKEVVGEKHPNYAIVLLNLALVYDKLQNYEQALSLLQETYPILLNTFGNENKFTKICKEGLDRVQKALQNKT